MLHALDREIRAATFDCWGTLLEFEPGQRKSEEARVRALAQAAGQAGVALDLSAAREVLGRAHAKHHEHWSASRQTGSAEMAGWALEELGVPDPAIAAALTREFEEAALIDDIPTLDGARETLARLAERGVRLALICDTGFTPGRVIRQLLDRVGCLEFLEVLVFSDEAGMPKPHAPVFRAALDGLESHAVHAVHVGDLRRTDVAGARELGMGTVRIRAFNDDDSGLPEADAVADSHAHLRKILGL